MSNETTNEETMSIFLGIDVAKLSFDAAVVSGRDAGRGRKPAELPAQRFDRTPAGVAELMTWVRALSDVDLESNECVAVMEATGTYSTELAAWLVAEEQRIKPCIVNPHDAAHHRKSLGLRNNTDKLAARALALFGLERRPQPYEELAPERAELRALSRYRDHLVQQRTAMKNRLKETAPSKWVRKREQAELKHLDKEILGVEKQLRAQVQKHEALQHDLELLTSVPGVGFLTAVVLLAEIGDLRRFGRAKQLSAFTGLSPAHNESGTSVRGRVQLSKKGNGRARQALYLAAMTTIRYESSLSEYYTKLVGQGKCPKAALGAIMRKLLTILRAMCIHNQKFTPKPESGGKTCGQPVENAPAGASHQSPVLNYVGKSSSIFSA